MTELFSDEYWTRHVEVERALRADGPVHHARLPTGVAVWVVTRHDEARAALADPRLSKDANRLTAVMRDKLAAAGGDTRLSGLFGPTVVYSDPPEHTRKRNLLLREFTARRVSELRPRIEAICAELLDGLPPGEVDLIAEFAFPMPATVICELLGVPTGDQEKFRHWTAALMQDVPEIVNPASDAMAAYFTSLIAAKTADPRDDLLSALIHTPRERLSDAELLGNAFVLFIAGHETTTNLIGNAVHTLLSEPGRWRELAAEPARVDAVVEEVLRLHPPVRMATHRLTTEPVIIGTTVVPAGEIVLIALGSAGRDACRYERADEFDPDRSEVGHLSFGHGVHHCLGSALGRLEARIALTQLTGRFPGARLAGPGTQNRSVIMNGFSSLSAHLEQKS